MDKEILMLLFVPVIIVVGIIFYKRNQKQTKINSLRLQYGELPEVEHRVEDLESIRSSYEYLKKDDDVDSITWNDLDIDTVFDQINATQSTHGDEWLYTRLHRQRCADSELLEKNIRFFDEHESNRVQLQYHLFRLGKHTDHGTYAFLKKIHSIQALNPVRYLLQTLGLLVSIVLLFVAPQYGIYGTFGFVCFNCFTYFDKKQPFRKYMQNTTLIVNSINTAKRIAKSNDLDQTPELKESLNRVLNQTLSIQQNLRFTFSAQSKDEFAMAASLFDSFLLITPLFFNRALSTIKKERASLYKLFEILGEIDGIIAIASYRKSLPYWSHVTFTEDTSYTFESLVHPVLAYKYPVANSGSLEPHLVLTGSNASGKSTFIKALALNALLGQNINTCTAMSISFKPCHIFTSMALRDSIQDSKSYFIVELESLKRLFNAVETYPYCFIVVDEILRGTNTKERIAASAVLLDSLAQKACSISVATHDIELTQILAETYSNYHFRETVDDDTVTFDYKLHVGPSTTTNAIKLLRMKKFSPDLIKKAYEMVEENKKNATWKLPS